MSIFCHTFFHVTALHEVRHLVPPWLLRSSSSPPTVKCPLVNLLWPTTIYYRNKIIIIIIIIIIILKTCMYVYIYIYIYICYDLKVRCFHRPTDRVHLYVRICTNVFIVNLLYRIFSTAEVKINNTMIIISIRIVYYFA